MKHKPERTCIGCRRVFSKEDVVRIASGPHGPMLDYREKLPGRAAYVCPNRECIEKALRRDNLSRALKVSANAPSADQFMKMLSANISEKIRALISISAKAGKLSAGYSAVADAFEKGRLEIVVYATDLAEGTKEKLALTGSGMREATVLTRDELGRILGREYVGVVGIEDKGLADSVWKETQRLKSLINSHE